MTLLAWPALLLLIAGGVLFALATLGAGPRKREVGTLMIWQRVAAKRAATQQRRRSYDLLLWLSVSAVLLGSLAAARPGLLRSEDAARIAVFVEATGANGRQLDLADVKARAESQADGEFAYFMAGEAAEGQSLPGGPIEAQLAQFRRAASEFDARILFLNAPAPHAEGIGLVLPRVSSTREGVVYDVRTQGEQLVVKRSEGTAPSVSGASLIREATSGREFTSVYEITADRVTVSAEPELTLQRRPFAVGVGTQWSTSAHRALYEVLGATDSTDEEVELWLGSADKSPALRLGLGQGADLTSAELSFDPQHALFRDVPLRDIDWLGAGRVMPLETDARPLLRAVVDGEPVGDIIRLRGDVLEFAADPFTAAPIASAALLLDNAVGVLTGERASERERYEVLGEVELPSRRAALAASFEPTGELDLSTRSAAEPLEFSTWLMLIAGLAAIGAGYLAARKQSPQR